MGVNFWFENVVDAYLDAVAKGEDWRPAVNEALTSKEPRRLLTQKDLRAKGVKYSRQHLTKLLRKRTFPQPFQFPAE
jgi:hypothetical protein